MEVQTLLKTSKHTAVKLSGAEAVIKTLINEGVEKIFGYPGGAIMPIYDAIYDYLDVVTHYLPRHEQGAIHAAEAYAKISGKTGVVFATSGPGATNLITGLANAMVDSTPLVCITGQVSSQLLGYDAFQETDVVGVSMPVTKWNYQVTSADEIMEVISKAFYIASTGRPGPVLIDITKDAQMSKTDYLYQKVSRVAAYYPYPKIEDEQVKKAAILINQAQRPLILAGQGVKLSRAEELLVKLSEKANIPVAATLWGLTAFPSSHSNYVGMLGMHGNYAPNILTNEADLIIAIGMRFDDRVTGKTSEYAKSAKIIHIEIDKSEIDKIIRTDVAVVGDAREVLSKLIPLVENKQHEHWLEQFKELRKTECDQVISEAINPQTPGLKMAEIIHRISEKTKGEAVVIADVGQHQMMTARYFKFKYHNHFITSGGLGTMGFGLPASFGASVASPDKPVVLFVGDGGFQMTIQELATIANNRANVKIVVLNNNFLGMVRQWQQLFNQKRYSFTTMQNPDFTKIAGAYGLKANKLLKRENIDEILNEMFANDEPYFLEVEIEKEENVFPMVPPNESVSNMLLKADY
jgi:acetolactate synthase-1/2/3 large subunit